MDGLEQKLDAILSDPESMQKIMDLAKGLGLSSPPRSENGETPPPPPQSANSLGSEPLMGLGTLLSSFSGQSLDSKHTALLNALRPYLRPERQERLDRAIQTAKLVKTAKLAMRQFNP